MGMTVTEKEHFQKRLDERVTELKQEILHEDVNWRRELAKNAVEITEQHYGITEMLDELKDRQPRKVETERNAPKTTKGKK